MNEIKASVRLKLINSIEFYSISFEYQFASFLLTGEEKKVCVAFSIHENVNQSADKYGDVAFDIRYDKKLIDPNNTDKLPLALDVDIEYVSSQISFFDVKILI